MFETTTLPNGVRILTARMDGAPSVAAFVGIASGSRYEQPASAGIAHFAEHMFFKGTERRPPRATSRPRSTASAASSTPSRARR